MTQDVINILFAIFCVWTIVMHFQAAKLFRILQQWNKSEDDAIMKLFGYLEKSADKDLQWAKAKMEFMQRQEEARNNGKTM